MLKNYRRIVDKDWYQTEFDRRAASWSEVYGYQPVMEMEHHKIHDSKHFTCQCYDDDVDAATPKYFHIKTGATKECHYIFEIHASKNWLIEFFEAPTTTADWTQATAYNNDRKSAVTAETTCYADPTVTADGTRLLVNVIGTDSASPIGWSGWATTRGREFILEASTSYLVKFTAQNDNTRVSCCHEFYEV